ncbi:MAG: DUF3990 domain-containing protein [Clostridia bacterium]|nr:DUF3990 domain-containing protein [Clostridia bacterium]
MILYHGSQEIVDKPEFGKGGLNNDYGQGFYCTESLELSKEWACSSDMFGFSNKYEFDITGLKILDLNSKDYNVLNWIAVLLNNRYFEKRTIIAREASDYLIQEFLPDIYEYDVVCGYRADDSYFSYAKDFINNSISVTQLSRAMKLGDLGNQIVLISPKSFEQIKYLGFEIADSTIYYNKRMQRETKARRAYLDNHGADFDVGSELFVRDIINEKVKNDDPRLR